VMINAIGVRSLYSEVERYCQDSLWRALLPQVVAIYLCDEEVPLSPDHDLVKCSLSFLSKNNKFVVKEDVVMEVLLLYFKNKNINICEEVVKMYQSSSVGNDPQIFGRKFDFWLALAVLDQSIRQGKVLFPSLDCNYTWWKNREVMKITKIRKLRTFDDFLAAIRQWDKNTCYLPPERMGTGDSLILGPILWSYGNKTTAKANLNATTASSNVESTNLLKNAFHGNTKRKDFLDEICKRVQNKELQGYVCVQVELPKFVGEKPGISQKDALKFCERSENNAIDTVTINLDLSNSDTLFPNSVVSYFDSKWKPQQQQLSSSIHLMISSQLPPVGEHLIPLC